VIITQCHIASQSSIFEHVASLIRDRLAPPGMSSIVRRLALTNRMTEPRRHNGERSMRSLDAELASYCVR
jgi:hypothetical protein